MNESNRQFAESNPRFKNACEKAGVPPTKRQASKFRNERGAAWKALKK